MPKYIALTIGPIYRITKTARSTRAMWSASYLISWIMRELVKELRKNQLLISPFDGNIEGKDLCDTEKRGVGLFHDRLIFQAVNGYELKDFNGLVASTIKKLAGIIADDTNSKKSEVEIFLTDYLQLYALELETDSQSTFMDISNYLDTLECQTAFVNKETKPYLVDFFERLDGGKYNSFIREQFQEKRFPSSAEIATADLMDIDTEVSKLRENEKGIKEENAVDLNRIKRLLKQDIDNQIKFYSSISKLETARQRHKYIAIIQGDGDNMSELIKVISQAKTESPLSERYKPFSRQLMAFALAASEQIKEFGATNVYAGGDDLLFFSPLVGKNGKSFLSLIEELDGLFKTYILEHDSLKDFIAACDEKKPSMSYGISISYYKFPMGESHTISYEQLKKAKQLNGKNGAAFEVRKHSGQEFGGLFSKEVHSFAFKHITNDKGKEVKDEQHTSHFGLLQDLANMAIGEGHTEKFISSFTHKLGLHETILNVLSAMPNFYDMLLHFFDNNFDEPIHKTESSKKYIRRVANLTYALLLPEKVNQPTSFAERLRKLYAALRLAQFIRLPFKEEENRQ
jgi:CRISPR-associated protein Cmr2